jgi:UDP-glucose 4-epimerase
MVRTAKLALVTGGAGFIGSNLVQELVRRRWKVRVLDDFSTGKSANLERLAGRIDIVRGYIRHAAVCRRAVQGVRSVFHLAALPSVIRSVKEPLPSNAVNVTGTLNLLEASRRAGVESFVSSSSSSVYGDTPRLPKKESMRELPLSPYAVSKMAAEKYCQIFHGLYGLRTVALRYFNIYGPRQDPASDYAAVIPKFITSILRDEQPTIYGDGRQTRDFTFVKDAVQANVIAAESEGAGGAAVNIGAGYRTSLLELVKEINGVLGKDIEPLFEGPRPGDVKHSLASVDLAGQTIGYEPAYSLEEGLEETVRFFKREARVRR